MRRYIELGEADGAERRNEWGDQFVVRSRTPTSVCSKTGHYK